MPELDIERYKMDCCYFCPLCINKRERKIKIDYYNDIKIVEEGTCSYANQTVDLGSPCLIDWEEEAWLKRMEESDYSD